MVPRQGRPLQTWKTFLRNHAERIASIDRFMVPTVAFEQLFGFLVLGHSRRRLIWLAVTAHLTANEKIRPPTKPCALSKIISWDGTRTAAPTTLTLLAEEEAKEPQPPRQM
jgi:hypothetical protein